MRRDNTRTAFNAACALLLVFITARPCAAADEATCYFPDGSVHPLGSRCDPDAVGATSCCQSTHTCLSNGLCWDTQNNHVLRASCTDSNWKADACAKICIGEAQGGRLGHMRQCNGADNEWTCGRSATNCTLPFSLSPAYVQDKRAAGVSNVLYANSVNGGSSGASSGQTALTTGLGAGLGVGVPLLVALLVSLFFLRKARRDLATAKNPAAPSSAASPPSPWQHQQPAASPYLGKDQALSPTYVGSTPSQTLQGYSPQQAVLYQPQPIMRPQELDGDRENHPVAEMMSRLSYDEGGTMRGNDTGSYPLRG